MSKHLKKYAAPTTWQITRKDSVYITKPSAGPHSIRMSIPISIILKKLGYAKTNKEIKKILTAKEILVDGRQVQESTFPAGIFDTISFKTIKQNYRILFDSQGKLS
ncbi:30S ribosomal protein S4e, partial [Candidatus Woesearchaeota archaeon]|nr:30S ribosomal protein S4e [Candidatus Woesearchaeota archaeon]